MLFQKYLISLKIESEFDILFSAIFEAFTKFELFELSWRESSLFEVFEEFLVEEPELDDLEEKHEHDDLFGDEFEDKNEVEVDLILEIL